MVIRTTTHIVKAIYFDEGPPPPPQRLTNPSRLSGEVRANIDTRLIDGYRQGVELTLQKHYDMGTVKIHSGEPDHVLRQSRFGMDIYHDPNSSAYSDNDKFNPVKFIKVQEYYSYLYSDVFTVPFIIDDNDEVTTDNFDGVIEPLTIRDVVALRSLEAPFIAHSVKAGLAGGSDDFQRGSCPVIQLDYFFPTRNTVVYDDRGYFKNEFVKIKPFDDVNLPDTGFMDTDLAFMLRLMRPSTGNFVPNGYKSFCAGWDYDGNVNIGTDSIAFGGMTY
jgi:hypothetical protein